MLNDGGEIRRKRQWMTSDEERYSISHEGGATNGSEQFADRPAVVVSNDENNKHSGVIEVVYMTTQPKTDLPTHVTVRSTGRLSTVLCEQVSSVSTDRVNNYIGQVSEQEMKNIDIALMISLQLSGGGKTSKQYNETIQKQQEEIEYYRNKIQAMQQSLEEKKTEKPQEAAGETSEIVVRLETERNTYMTGNSLSKTITKTRYTAEFKFTGYWFSDEVSLNWQGAYEAIFEAQGNRATPCRLTITATEYIEQLRINGLSCGEIIIDTIPRGATVIIDGETGFATMDGENKFKDVSLMEFPYLTTGQEKEHHLIFSDNNALVTLQYKPMWL